METHKDSVEARTNQRKGISMASPSLKTCDKDKDESKDYLNNESDEELYISNYNWHTL